MEDDLQVITRIDLQDMPAPHERDGNSVRRDLLNFLDFGWECAEIDMTRYKSVRSGKEAYFTSAVRAGLDGQISVVRRGKRVFLVRKDG